ncbi:MAG TPA: hypothetical protein VFD58_36265 [Blastocatellia bacterium]|nr:hypothetical protein [Blastocatellia bacterium]
MSRMKSLLAGGAVLLTVFGFAAFSTPRAVPAPTSQSPQGDGGQTTQALLNEVRELRLAIQRSSLNGYHAQVTLERLRLQQQRVDRLNERLEGVHSEMGELQRQKSHFLEESRRLETRLGQEPDPNKRRELDDMQQRFKAEAERRLPERESRARETESQMTAQLQMEQSRLNELNDRLDALQKELEIVDKPQQNGKRQ